MRSLLFFIATVYSISTVEAYSFKDVAVRIYKHEKIEAMLAQAHAIKDEGRARSSWGDPKLNIAARNFPVKNLVADESNMTGIEFGVAQNFPLSTKNQHIQNSYNLLSKSAELEAIHQRRALLQLLWNLAILKRNLQKDEGILKENLVWIENILAVSNKLYANGKLTQQAVLELQVRKAQLEAELSNKKHERENVNERLNYLYGAEGEELDLATVPWKLLELSNQNNPTEDFKLKSLEAIAKASDSKQRAQKLSFIPDVTVSASYMKRHENFQDVGDFVGVGLTFTLPLSSKEYGEFDKAVNERVQSQKALKDYRWLRKTEIAGLRHQIMKITDELSILNKQAIVYASSSRDITAKSYGLGNTSYIELTQSELNLLKLLLRKTNLEAQLASKQIELKYLQGEDLHVD